MTREFNWIETVSKSAVFLAIAFVLCGFRAWGDDYSHSNTLIAQAEADKDRSIIAAIEASSADAIERDKQRQESISKLIEVNRILLERIDGLTAELARRAGE